MKRKTLIVNFTPMDKAMNCGRGFLKFNRGIIMGEKILVQVLLFIIIAFRGVEKEGAIERIFKIYRFLVANSFCGERAIVLHIV